MLTKVFLGGSARLGLCRLACVFAQGNCGASPQRRRLGAAVPTPGSLFGSSRLRRGSAGSRMAGVRARRGGAQPVKPRARAAHTLQRVLLLEFDYKVKGA